MITYITVNLFQVIALFLYSLNTAEKIKFVIFPWAIEMEH